MRAWVLLLFCAATATAVADYEYTLDAVWMPPVGAVTLSVPTWCSGKWRHRFTVYEAVNIRKLPPVNATFWTHGNLTLQAMNYAPMRMRARWETTCVDVNHIAMPGKPYRMYHLLLAPILLATWCPWQRSGLERACESPNNGDAGQRENTHGRD
jgi:hypothetical protein